MDSSNARRGGAVVLAAFAAASLAPLAQAQTISVEYDGPVLDRWMYPFNGTPGIRQFISVFGATGEPDFDDRDGQMIVGFDTDADVPSGLGVDSYDVLSATVTVMYDGQVEFVYDDTQDSYTAFLDPEDPDFVPDADDGQPLELYGLGYRNDFDLFSFVENTPYGGVFGEGIRNAYGMDFDDADTAIDVSNNVRDRFDPSPGPSARSRASRRGRWSRRCRRSRSRSTSPTGTCRPTCAKRSTPAGSVLPSPRSTSSRSRRAHSPPSSPARTAS